MAKKLTEMAPQVLLPLRFCATQTQSESKPVSTKASFFLFFFNDHAHSIQMFLGQGLDQALAATYATALATARSFKPLG